MIDSLLWTRSLLYAFCPRGGGGTPILGLGRGSAVMTPVFEIFNPIGSIFYNSTQSDWVIGLSLSHLVPEKLGPKVGVIFTKMYYLTDFKHFVSIFPSFSIQLTPFSISFKFFDPSFLQKLRSDWVHFFFVCCTRVPTIWWSTPPGHEDLW